MMIIDLPIDRLIQEDQKLHTKLCDAEGCQLEGSHRAPKSRDKLREYWWFCLDHVRAYNQSWNYYAGMNEQDFQADQDLAARWDRPTWPLGGHLKSEHMSTFRDHLDLLNNIGLNQKNVMQNRSPFPPHSEQSKALIELDLSWPVDLGMLKKRYKELAKKFHPDLNKNDKIAEDKLKKINGAYSALKKAIEAI